MITVLNRLRKFFESSVDFPSEDLPLDIWEKTEDAYILKPELKQKILDALDEYPDLNLLDIADKIHVVGSIGTNLYDEDADIDIHITPDTDKLPTKDPEELEQLQRDVMDWFKNERDEKDWYVNKHPFEVYLQLNLTQDYYSDTVYDLLEDKWVKPFKKYSIDYNPYQVYSDVFTELSNVVAPADIAVGELRRDVIDFNRLMDAINKSSKEVKEQLQITLEGKLNELENDIEELVKNKELWRSIRRRNSINLDDVEQDISQLTHSEAWNKDNFLFKMLDRYQYMTLVNDLKKLIDDKELTEDDVPKIEDLLKRFNEEMHINKKYSSLKESNNDLYIVKATSVGFGGKDVNYLVYKNGKLSDTSIEELATPLPKTEWKEILEQQGRNYRFGNAVFSFKKYFNPNDGDYIILHYTPQSSEGTWKLQDVKRELNKQGIKVDNVESYKKHGRYGKPITAYRLYIDKQYKDELRNFVKVNTPVADMQLQ